MKKIIALIMAVVILTVMCSCGGGNPAQTTDTTTTETTSPVDKNIKIEGGELKACIGQADENGVYTVPSNISIIGEMCFGGDTTLKKIIIPASVEMIGSAAFTGCTSLEEVIIEDGVKTLGSHAFWGCTSLESIELPESITVVPAYAFAYCTSLERITLGDKVTGIGHDAFTYCSALEEIIAPSAIENIGGMAFLNCSSLTNVDFSKADRLDSIGLGTFGNCISLRKVVLPESLTTVGQEVFYGCTALVDISIGGKLSSVGPNAFNYTPWYRENTEDYLIVGDGVLIKCNVIPKYIDLSGKGIKVIGGAAFFNDKAANGTADSLYGYKYADQLTSIVIPEGVTTIQTAAFYYCYALENIKLPSTLEVIESSAFETYIANGGIGATAKIDLTPCTKLTTIGASAFNGCGGTDEIFIPDTVEYVGSDAFANTKAYSDFYDALVESEKSAYKVVDGVLLWSYIPNGETTIEVPDGVRMIAGGACKGWDNAVVATSPNGLRPEWLTKYNITNVVTEIIIPEGVKVIGDNAFVNTKLVTEINIPSSVESIRDGAFNMSAGLTKITLPEGLISIGSSAFNACYALGSIELPSTIQYIGAGAFASCSSLKVLVVPKGTSLVDSEIFDSGCTALEQVYLPKQFRSDVYDVLGEVVGNIKVSYYKD